MNLSVVGTGTLIEEILGELVKVKGINVGYITSTKRSFHKAKEFQTAYSIPKVFDDYETMLKASKGETDAVYLATPNHTHYAMAAMALKEGYHVILEKPFTQTVKEANALFELAEENHVFLFEAITNRYYKQLEILQAALPKLGTITYADFNFSQYSRKFDRYLNGEYFPVFDHAKGGGALMDLNIYNIHACTALFKKPESVLYKPVLATRKGTDEYVDVSGVCLLQYPNMIATLTGCKSCKGPSRILIEGTTGYIEQRSTASLMDAPMLYYNRLTNETTDLIKDVCIPYRIVNEFESFATMIETKDSEAYWLHKEETLIAMEVLENAFAQIKK